MKKTSKIVIKDAPVQRDQQPSDKFDLGKLRYDLIPPEPLEELVKVYNFGAAKYGDTNWKKGMSWSRYFSALMRHAWAFWRGETYDKETGIHHLAHCAWSCFSLIWYTDNRKTFDDRPNSLQQPKQD